MAGDFRHRFNDRQNDSLVSFFGRDDEADACVDDDDDEDEDGIDSNNIFTKDFDQRNLYCTMTR
jgi:hypothetical protein